MFVHTRVSFMIQVELASWIWYQSAFGGEAPVLEIWGIWRAPSLPLIPGPLWPGMIQPVRVPYIGQIEQFNHLTVCKQITVELFVLDSSTWNHTTK